MRECLRHREGKEQLKVWYLKIKEKKDWILRTKLIILEQRKIEIWELVYIYKRKKKNFGAS